jgi:predicted alpha/beta superfamily hydrolase
LNRLTGKLIPEAEAGLGFMPEQRGVMGYSLAGLFALYAFLNSELFCLAGSVSGSLWYDGWLDYLNRAIKKGKKGKIYLSVGDREAHARNRRMKCAVENTRLTEAVLRVAGMETLFELSRGGHFDDEQGRLERCLAWLAGRGRSLRGDV